MLDRGEGRKKITQTRRKKQAEFCTLCRLEIGRSVESFFSVCQNVENVDAVSGKVEETVERDFTKGIKGRFSTKYGSWNLYPLKNPSESPSSFNPVFNTR